VRNINHLIDCGNCRARHSGSDTQDLQAPAFRWLKKETGVLAQPALKRFEAEQLEVFTAPPADQRNTGIDEVFVPAAAHRHAARRGPCRLDVACERREAVGRNHHRLTRQDITSMMAASRSKSP
jgi:hypothetical protein